MIPKHRDIRSSLSGMAPPRAIEYIKAFQLPKDEENVLILCDVNDLSYSEVEEKLGMSTSTIKNKRRKAFSKIADAMEHINDPAVK